MKKELYEKPILEIIALLDVNIITDSPIEPGDIDDPFGSAFGLTMNRIMSSLISPWYLTDENGNIIYDENGNPIYDPDKIEADKEGWEAYQESLNKADSVKSNKESDNQQWEGDLTQQEQNTEGEGVEGFTEVSESESVNNQETPTEDNGFESQTAGSILEAVVQELNNSSNEVDENYGFDESTASTSETPPAE